jgi:lauroyl/myristoyl acyltransferase
MLQTWRLYWTFGQCLVDRAVAGITGDYCFDESARKRLSSLEAAGTGLILLAAHTGCWQMAPYGLARHAVCPVSVLVHRETGDIDRLPHEHSGTAAPFSMIGADAGMLAPVELLKRLRRGELLCMMGDRVMGEPDPAVEALFFGEKIRVPYLPYRLASASGSTVAFAFALRTGQGRGHLRLESGIRVPTSLGNNPAAYQPYAQKFVSSLEAFVQRHPHQFFNFHNLWEQ